MSDVLTEEMLSKVARNLSWDAVRPLAFEYLSFKNSEIENIAREHPEDIVARNHKVLFKWRNKTRGTSRSLHEILDKARLDGIYIDPAVNQIFDAQELPDHFHQFQEDIKHVYAQDLAEISINPADPSQRIPVEDIHVDVDLQVIDDLKLERTRITSYVEAFSGGDDIDRIVLFAAPGAGKTVQCKIIAFKWAKYGILFEKYKLVIFLQLSGVSRSEEVSQIIINQLMPDMKDQQEQITKILKENKKDILFLADGYDEMDTVTTKKTKGEFTVADLFKDKKSNLLVSTRPTRLDDLKNDVFLKRKLNMIGLSDENARKLAKLYCEKRSIPAKSEEQSIEDFIMQELHEKNLMDLSKNPATLTMVCNWMRENDVMSASLTALYEYFFNNLKDTFLKTDHMDKDKQRIKNMLINEDDDEIMKALEHFAFVCVMKSQVISTEKDYIQILKNEFVRACVALGMIYFQERIGCGQRMIGFRHKSQGEFLAAKYINRQLHSDVDFENEDQLRFLSECGDISKILYFERVLVFLSGLCHNEQTARLLMHTVTDVFDQLPTQHINTPQFNALDTDDIVRQLALLQIRCKGELACNNHISESCPQFIKSLNENVPHLDHFPQSKDLFADEQFNRIPASTEPVLPLQGQSNQTTSTEMLKTITNKDICSRKRKLPEDKAASNYFSPAFSKNDLEGDFIQTFSFRTVEEKNVYAVRIDKIAVASNNKSLDRLPTDASKKCCYFVPILSKGFSVLSDKAMDIIAVGFNMPDIGQLQFCMNRFVQNACKAHVETSGGYVLKLETRSNTIEIDTKLEDSCTLAALNDLEKKCFLPVSNLHLTKWKFNDAVQEELQVYLKKRKHTVDVLLKEDCQYDRKWQLDILRLGLPLMVKHDGILALPRDWVTWVNSAVDSSWLKELNYIDIICRGCTFTEHQPALRRCYDLSQQRGIGVGMIPLKLVCEPENQYDKNAIGLWAFTGQLYEKVGYVGVKQIPRVTKALLSHSIRHVCFSGEEPKEMPDGNIQSWCRIGMIGTWERIDNDNTYNSQKVI